MHWNDMQADVIREMGELLACPDLSAEELGYTVLTLDALIRAEQISEATANDMLADRMWRAGP